MRDKGVYYRMGLRSHSQRVNTDVGDYVVKGFGWSNTTSGRQQLVGDGRLCMVPRQHPHSALPTLVVTTKRRGLLEPFSLIPCARGDRVLALNSLTYRDVLAAAYALQTVASIRKDANAGPAQVQHPAPDSYKTDLTRVDHG